MGINTAIVGDTYHGISFAIPSSVAQHVYKQLRSRGYVARAWLGVQVEAVPTEVAKRNDLPSPKGAWVRYVMENNAHPTPAQLAGLKPGDIIVRFNGQQVVSFSSLTDQIGACDVGSRAEIEVVREGEQLFLETVLGEKPRMID